MTTFTAAGQQQDLTASRRIAVFSTTFGPERLDADELVLCGRSLADTYGVAVAGRHEHAPRAALRYLRDAGLLVGSEDDRAGSAALWGTPFRAAPEIAAWWNGVAGHVLDYDDVTVPMRGHPSVVLWPALLALAQARALPPRRLSSAFCVGMEVICKLSRGIAMAHYGIGWHATATIGTIGATVACAHLLGLDATQTVHAIGIAVAQAAGSRENVGTESKSFQAGHANGAAVRAASLAAAGFEAGERALDGAHGFVRLYAGSGNGPELEDLGEAPLELRRSGLDVKQYPMCYATHRALDAVLALRREHGITLADVERVDVETSPEALVPLVHPYPVTGLQGKFSMAYAMAAALADGAIRLTSFVDEAVMRPEIQRFLRHVHARESDVPTSARWAEVTLSLHDGRRLSRHVETLHGSSSDPLSEAELIAKLDDCLQWGKAPGRGRELLENCLSHHRLSAHELLDRLQSYSREETDD